MYISTINKKLEKELIMVDVCSNSASGWHTHPFFEFVYVLKGKAEHTINDNTMILSEGDYFLIDIGSRHEYMKLDTEPDLCIVNCMFKPRFIDETLRDAKNFYGIVDFCLPGLYDPNTARAATLRSYHDSTGYIGTVIRQMMREAQERDVGYLSVLKGLLINLLIELARNEAALPRSGNDGITRYIVEYVAKNYSHPLRLSEICEEMSFSLTYASSVFKRDMGMTFRDYLMKVRLEKACRLIQSSDKTVAEIAAAVGYSDPAFFFKIFKKELGLTPKDYKRAHAAAVTKFYGWKK